MAPIIEQAKIASKSSDDFLQAANIMKQAVDTMQGHQVIGGVPQTPANFTPPE
jgi:hypothetical protein